MQMFDRLKRITDLFSEGRECELGIDEAGVPVIMWVNKPNSFEEEESRRDGLAARTEHLLELKDDNHPEIVNARSQVDTWTDDEVVTARVNQKYDEDFVLAISDLEADKEWAEKLEYLRRTPALLDDAKVAEDDERRTKYAAVNQEYMAAMKVAVDERQAGRRRELVDLGRVQLVEDYMNEFRERAALEDYMSEKRITELFFAIRDCEATRRTDGIWDHKPCDHRRRLLMSRGDVRSLPQTVIDAATNTLENMVATVRDAGNSAAPANSSESSGPQSAAEDSSPSIPVETPSAAPTT